MLLYNINILYTVENQKKSFLCKVKLKICDFLIY